MSLTLPRLPQNPPSHAELQVWWQQVCEAIEGQEETQEETIADLAAQQAATAALTTSLTTTQATLTTALEDIEEALGLGEDNADSITSIDGRIDTLEADAPYVSQDVGAAWTAPTGTASRATFATYAAPDISAAYVEAEVQAIADHVQVLSQRLKAIVDDLKANGALT